MPIVHTTFQPDVPLEVSEAEAASLRSQGLLVEVEIFTEVRTAAAIANVGTAVVGPQVPSDGSWSAPITITNTADGTLTEPVEPGAAETPAIPDTPDPQGADTEKGSKA